MPFGQYALTANQQTRNKSYSAGNIAVGNAVNVPLFLEISMNCLTPIASQLTVQGFPARTGAYIPKTIQAQQHLIAWRNSNADVTDAWLRAILCEAFKRMIARRLQDTPASDMIVDVANDWADIIGEGMEFELDAVRVVAGFKRIFRECGRWPQPVDLFKRMPNRIIRPQAGTVNTEAVDEGAHERSAAALDAILKSLGG